MFDLDTYNEHFVIINVLFFNNCFLRYTTMSLYNMITLCNFNDVTNVCDRKDNSNYIVVL